MRYQWLSVVVLGALLLCGVLGCSSGGDRPKALTPQEYLTRGQQELESVTTNLVMNGDDARVILRNAARDFEAVLATDPENPKAKWGLVMSNTFFGFYDLMAVLPAGLDTAVLDLLMSARSPVKLENTPAEPLRAMAINELRSRARSSGSTINATQLRIASRTVPALTNTLPYLDDVEEAVRNGADIRLRLYQGGRIRTIDFDVADIQLISAVANGINALLNASISFNLYLSTGSAVKQLPVDSDGNGMFDAEEYLTVRPFLDRLYAKGVPGFLQYMRYAGLKAQQGAGLSGHTTGPNALINIESQGTKDAMSKLSRYAAMLVAASTTEVSTSIGFPDGQTRTINLPKLAELTSLRELMPSFQKNNLQAPGVWPDPTFRGVITPGIPQGFFKIYYRQIEFAY